MVALVLHLNVIGVEFGPGQAVERAEVQPTREDPICTAALPSSIAEEIDLALLFHNSLRLMKRANAGLAGGRWRAGTSAGGERAGPSAAGFDQLHLGTATIRRNMIPVAGWTGRNGQRRSGVLPIASFLFLRLVLVLPVAGRVPRTRRHPVQVLLEVSATATATARLERQVVTLFGPEILMTLPLGPASGTAAAFQIR